MRISKAEAMRIREGLAAASADRQRFGTIFLAGLFDREPALRAVFRGHPRSHIITLHQGLASIVASIDRLASVEPALEWLAARAARLGIGERHRAAFADALLAALEAQLGDAFTAEMRQAWMRGIAEVESRLAAAAAAVPLAA